MTVSAITAVLESLLTAAANTMSSPTCKDIVNGRPKTISRPVIAYWFTGIRQGISVYTKEQEKWGWAIKVHLPLGLRISPPRSQADVWVANLAIAIRTQIWGHYTVSGTVAMSEITDVRADEEEVGGINCLTAEMTWWPIVTDQIVAAA